MRGASLRPAAVNPRRSINSRAGPVSRRTRSRWRYARSNAKGGSSARVDCVGPRRRLCDRYGDTVGFNPFRAHATRRTDLLIVAAAFVVIAALVLWAVFG